MSDADLTLFYQKLFPLSVTSPHKKSKVSKVLKRASVGRFFRTGNFYFFCSGLSTAIGARKWA